MASDLLNTFAGDEEAMKRFTTTILSTPLGAPSFLDKIMASKIAPQPATEFDYVSGRRAGKNTLLRGVVRAADVSIPGFNSDEASRFPGGPDAYREELHRRNGTTPRPNKTKPIIATPEDFERIDMPAEAVTPEEVELQKLVDQYHEAFKATPRSFMLTAPAKHTTLTGKEYKIKPFIGGEEFEPWRAYVGKKHGTIIVLKPKYPCDFEFLEVPEKQCKTAFGAAFPMYMREVLSDVMDAKEELAAQARKLQEMERNAEAAAQYSEFGSW